MPQVKKNKERKEKQYQQLSSKEIHYVAGYPRTFSLYEFIVFVQFYNIQSNFKIF